MNRRLASLLGVCSFVATGCFVAEDKSPTVNLGVELPTKFVHRGMTQVDRPVVQPRLAVRLPTVTGDHLTFTAKATGELSNSTGDAWFPDGHAGRFTEIDFIADYQKKVGDVTLRGGIFSYNLPNGLEFPNGERGGTSEIFITASATVLEAKPYVSWHYDFDEVRAAYYRAGITEGFDLGQGFALQLDGSIGYAASAQSSWLYGINQSGWADLRGMAVLNYRYDDRTRLSAGVHGSAILDSTIDAWFTQLNIDDDPIWFSLAVGWSF